MSAMSARGSLDSKTYESLTTMPPSDQYVDRSLAIYHLFRGMYRAGWTEEEAREALSNPAIPGGDVWRSVLRGEPRRDGTFRKRPRKWLHTIWEGAVRDEDAHPRGRRTRDEMLEGERAAWLAIVNTYVLAAYPRQIGTFMLVAAYLASIADPDELTCRGSLRLIGERCALDPGTVQTALKALRTGGFLETLEVGTIDANGGGLGRTTPSSWRLVTVSDMGGTTPIGTIPPVSIRAVLPDGYGDIDASVNASARWLLLHLVDRELTITECAALVGMAERSVLLAQKDRRGGPLRQLLDLGLARKTSRGTYVARIQPTKKAVEAAKRVRFHGRQAIDRRRRMKVRHDQQRGRAIERLDELKRERMKARIDEYYRTRRGLSKELANRIAEATIRARQVTSPQEHPGRQRRVHEVRNDNRTTSRYTIGSKEVVVTVGDPVISRRAGGAGCRTIKAYRFSPYTPWDFVWRTEGRIVDASRLAEAIRDLPDLADRLRQVLPDPDDLAAVVAELEPVLSPYQRMRVADT